MLYIHYIKHQVYYYTYTERVCVHRYFHKYISTYMIIYIYMFYRGCPTFILLFVDSSRRWWRADDRTEPSYYVFVQVVLASQRRRLRSKSISYIICLLLWSSKTFSIWPKNGRFENCDNILKLNLKERLCISDTAGIESVINFWVSNDCWEIWYQSRTKNSTTNSDY